jgi:uncharacterized membrane protein YeaQ/YmgE (transglycosylase-associated protein family)
VLAAVLIAGRVALHVESGAGAPVADAIGLIGGVAVLAHLAKVWRDGSNPLQRFSVTASHVGALLLVALVTLGAARIETGRRRSNPPPSM